ncbi:hypothetical protein LCGC14_0976530 [marine sediment metagenome]|uniref:Uncharacterized protein n=1 Tax=marine sediment metagenome TaxID=412755 RepID=A0A0F9RGJ2_9ZZZZ
MKAKVLSVIVILAALAYLFFGLLAKQMPFRDGETFTGLETAAVVVSVIFMTVGLMFTGYASIRWILK